MSNNTIRRAVRCALVTGVATAATSAMLAQAAEEGTIQEVLVTGSRIVQPGLTSISPVVSVGSDQIKIEGVTRVEDLINNLPQAVADFGGNLSNGSTGAATVNLRGLGSQRTLVLVNSRRLMPGDPTQNGSASPDLNQIPTALIERVEVLTGGASAVYGADAVAGVVNFIMNDNFEGVRLDAQYSLYQHNQHSDSIAELVSGRNFALPDSNVTDGATKDLTFVAGINTPDGRGNATVYVGYRELEKIKQDQRDFSACSLGSGSSVRLRRLVDRGARPFPHAPGLAVRQLRQHDRLGQPAAALHCVGSVQLCAGQLLSASGRAQDRRPVRALRLRRQGQRLHRVHVHGRPHPRADRRQRRLPRRRVRVSRHSSATSPSTATTRS